LDGFRQEEVIAQAEALSEVLESGGALDVLLAESKARQAEILEMRSMLYEALRPGTAELFDICVPCSQVVGHVQFVRELEERLGIQLPTYGHAADGNVHTHHLRHSLEDGVLGGEIPNWRETREAVRQALYEDAIGRGGVISGEHGIGEVKRAYLERNLGSATLAIMRSVKRAMDPKGILNPGKIFDD
jgi:glycolate oxidase